MTFFAPQSLTTFFFISAWDNSRVNGSNPKIQHRKWGPRNQGLSTTIENFNFCCQISVDEIYFYIFSSSNPKKSQVAPSKSWSRGFDWAIAPGPKMKWYVSEYLHILIHPISLGTTTVARTIVTDAEPSYFLIGSLLGNWAQILANIFLLE